MEWRKNNQIHTPEQTVETLDIILKGSVRVYIGDAPIILGAGSVLGFSEKPHERYNFRYEAEEDCTLYSYPYQSEEELSKVIHVNERIAPSLAYAAVGLTDSFYKRYVSLEAEAKQAYAALQEKRNDYMDLCARLGNVPREFPELDAIDLPEADAVAEWRIDFLTAASENNDQMRRTVYSFGPDMCTGVIYTVANLLSKLTAACMDLLSYIKRIRETSAGFLLEYEEMNRRQRTLTRAVDASDSAAEMPDLSDAFTEILDYADFTGEDRALFTKRWESYKKLSDRQDSSDEVRRLRRDLTEDYYRIYLGAFLESQKNTQIPPVVKMFFYFGFLDPEIAGEANLRQMYLLAENYEPDPSGRIITLYEWLVRVYQGKSAPSRNEFDLDYPAYLREARQNGEITEQQEKMKLADPKSRLEFEVMNFFKLGNRMTFGRVTTFFPFFDEINAMMPLEKCYSSYLKIKQVLDRVRSMDCRCFYREEVFSDPEEGVNQLIVHREYLPYIILAPNIGSRSVLWQEIEGKKRTSCARMMMPIFNLQDMEESVFSMCGEFRWEMCKTEQGVHWNDLSDPSLTSEYSDYLQYYRKNQELNSDQREKVKKSLARFSNNFRRVFVSDYVTYLKYESRQALRLNKVARRILYTYCPFGEEIRKLLAVNPQYEQLITRSQNKNLQKLRPILNLTKKIESQGKPVPEEIQRETGFLSM